MIKHKERVPSVFLASPNRTAWMLNAGRDFTPQQPLVYVEKNIMVHKGMETGILQPDGRFIPFSISASRELAPHSGELQFSNGATQETRMYSEDGSNFVVNTLKIPKDAVGKDGTVALTLPVRLTPIQAMQYNVLRHAWEGVVRGPKVSVHEPQKQDDQTFLGFSGKNGQTLGIIIDGAQDVSVVEKKKQARPTKDFCLNIKPVPTNSTYYEVSLLALHDNAWMSDIQKRLTSSFRDLSSLESQSDQEWKTRTDALPHMTFEGSDPKLSKLVDMFNGTQVSLLKLHNTVGRGPEMGMMAGPKWPSQLYARDLAISIPGLLASGLSAEVRESLATLLKHQKTDVTKFDKWAEKLHIKGKKKAWLEGHLETWGMITPVGKIPHRIDETGADFTSIDSTALIVSAIKDYVSTTGDKGFLEQYRNNIHLALNAMDDITRNGNLPRSGPAFSRHGPMHVGQTWKDVDIRWGVATEVACQYEKAYRDMADILTIMNDPERTQRAQAKALLMRQEIHKLKDESGYPDSAIYIGKERFDNKKNTMESLIFPYLSGTDILDDQSREQVYAGIRKLHVPGVGIRAVEPGVKTKRELFFEKAVKTISRKNEAYHGEGTVWPFNSAFVSEFFLKDGNIPQGIELLDNVAAQMNSATHNGIPEVMRLDGTASDECPIQTWSGAKPTEVFYKNVLGISVDMLNGTPKLTLNPLDLSKIYKGGPFNLSIDNLKIGAAIVKLEYTDKGYTISRSDTSHQPLTINTIDTNFTSYPHTTHTFLFTSPSLETT